MFTEENFSKLIEMHKDTVFRIALNYIKCIGASLEGKGENYIINYLGRTIEFRLNDDRILVDGEERILTAKATFNGQDLVLPRDFFSILGVRDTMYYPLRGGSVQAPDSWLVIP